MSAKCSLPWSADLLNPPRAWRSVKNIAAVNSWTVIRVLEPAGICHTHTHAHIQSLACDLAWPTAASALKKMLFWSEDLTRQRIVKHPTDKDRSVRQGFGLGGDAWRNDHSRRCRCDLTYTVDMYLGLSWVVEGQWRRPSLALTMFWHWRTSFVVTSHIKNMKYSMASKTVSNLDSFTRCWSV